jgi:hypothetical protein
MRDLFALPNTYVVARQSSRRAQSRLRDPSAAFSKNIIVQWAPSLYPINFVDGDTPLLWSEVNPTMNAWNNFVISISRNLSIDSALNVTEAFY